mgnify:CR=1 FL=1
MPTNKRRQASKTPTPPGAAGTTKPKDHDNEKIINKNTKVVVFLYLGGSFSDDFFKILELCKQKKIIYASNVKSLSYGRIRIYSP